MSRQEQSVKNQAPHTQGMKRSSTYLLFAFIAAVVSFIACDDTASPIGSSLSGQNTEIVIDSSFTLTGHSVAIDSIIPKTTLQVLGTIDIPAYGRLSSDFVAQFLPSTVLDTATFAVEHVDSLMLNLSYAGGAFIGDSVAPMGLTVYALEKQLPKNIASNFNPEGYYNKTPLASKIYNVSSLDVALNKTNTGITGHMITLRLPLELGRKLFSTFVENPAKYADGHIFSEDVFPGIYIKSTYGNGRITRISTCSMSMHMRKIYVPEGETKPDTVSAEHVYYLVTPEVISNNNISYKMAPKLADMLSAGHTLMVAPLGAEVEFTFPAKEIMDKYRSESGKLSVINGLTMSIPVDTIENGFGITPPPFVLMVLKKDRKEFFAKNKLPDNVTSFYAIYNAETQSYSFVGMRAYITSLLEKKDDEITPDDYTFSLVPVQVNFENLAGYYYSTSQTEAEVLPYLMSPVMADVRLDKAKIIFTYSLQTQK